MTAPIFTCSICKKERVATERDNAPITVDVEKLRAEYYAAHDLLEEQYKDPKNDTIQSYERKLERTSMAYFSQCFRTNVWQVPKTLLSHKGASGYFLHCETCQPNSVSRRM